MAAEESLWFLDLFPGDIPSGVLCGTFGLGLAVLYGMYYWLFAVDQPQIYAHDDSSLLEVLKQRCPVLSEYYWPTFWAYHAHVTSVFRARWQSHVHIEFTRHILTLADGGEVALDYAAPERCDDAGPVLLVLPGLTGGTGHNYIGHLVTDGIQQGFKTVVCNQRGTGGLKMKTPRTYCAADTSDLRQIIAHTKTEHPDSLIMAVGVSLGGMLLIKYLHESGSASSLDGVVTFSTPWDPLASKYALETFPNKYLYNYFFTWKLKKMILSNAKNLKERTDVPYDFEALSKAKTLEEFDAQVTIKVFKYPTVDRYYKEARNKDRIKDVKTPLVSFNAADDPFVPSFTLPKKEFQSNENVALVVTKRGGHFGFLEGWLPIGSTWMNRALRQSLAALLHHHATRLHHGNL